MREVVHASQPGHENSEKPADKFIHSTAYQAYLAGPTSPGNAHGYGGGRWHDMMMLSVSVVDESDGNLKRTLGIAVMTS